MRPVTLIGLVAAVFATVPTAPAPALGRAAAVATGVVAPAGASGVRPVDGTATVSTSVPTATGGVLVGGSVAGPGGTTAYVARFSGDGAPDAGFGGDGLVVLAEGPDVAALTVAPDGGVLAALPLDDTAPDARTVVVRLDAAGAPAASWTPATVAHAPADTTLATARAAGVVGDPGGWAWLITEHVSPSGPGGVDVTKTVITRLAADGSVDPGFGGNTEVGPFGRLVQVIPPVGDGAIAIVVASPQNLAQPERGEVMAVQRFGPTGTYQGSQPVLATPLDEPVRDPHIVVRPGRGYLLTGTTADGRVALAGLAPGLGPDATFGSDGYRSVAVDGGTGLAPLDTTDALTFLTDGGTRLLRVLPTGWVDPRFAPDGGSRRAVPWTPGPRVQPLGAGAVALVTGGAGVGVTRVALPASDGGCTPRGAAGYWMAAADGAVYAFGAAGYHGRVVRGPNGADVVALGGSPDGCGYWVADTSGAVTSFGAPPLDPPDRTRWVAGERLAAMSPAPSGTGAFWFTTRGRVLSQGGAPGLGDMAGARLAGPVLDGVSTTTGRGYWMVGSDGGVFAFGDARFAGSMGGVPLTAPVQTLVPTPSGRGYWLVAADGGVFAFGDAPFLGSMGGSPLNQPIVGAVAYGDGYLLVAADGGIFNFSDLPFLGSMGASPPASPVVDVAALP